MEEPGFEWQICGTSRSMPIALIKIVSMSKVLISTWYNSERRGDNSRAFGHLIQWAGCGGMDGSQVISHLSTQSWHFIPPPCCSFLYQLITVFLTHPTVSQWRVFCLFHAHYSQISGLPSSLPPGNWHCPVYVLYFLKLFFSWPIPVPSSESPHSTAYKSKLEVREAL